MIPPLIVKRATGLALSIIAVTDHNSAENAGAVLEAAQGADLTVLPGMEVQSREEVHLLCLFDTLEQVLEWQDVVYAHLPPLRNTPEVFGAQFVVDASGDFVRHNDRLLLASTSFSVEEIASGVGERSGLCIPAHVDRPSFSLLANLGFVPQGASFAAMELTGRTNSRALRQRYPELAHYSFVRSGDAHRLSEMTNSTILTIEEPSITEITWAFRRQQGRRVNVVE
jgi:PHP family Zn ribbon phosphoesterase